MMGWVEKENQHPNLTFLPHTWTPIEVGYESHQCMYTFAVSSVLSRLECLLGLLFVVGLRGWSLHILVQGQLVKRDLHYL